MHIWYKLRETQNIKRDGDTSQYKNGVCKLNAGYG